ncbi:phage baseplate assembly protein V [uncultured Flavonifractor sp.]|uniref:phage baseplate assembly protein V n=1 Tax=uncultured Flavonifractor sp. TaxID=1193534 RepID=UPI0026272000|nr:phage baseplate assembly protein V [uncultured Flavonifractor sp.]
MYNIAQELQAAMSAAGNNLEWQTRRPGLSLAVVTNINDDQKLNRVKCLPIENNQVEETDWCYVMAPMGGKEHGQFFFPSVNDLVVLAYLGGDPHRPLVLGAIWTAQVPPPYTIQNGKVHNYSIKTPTGTELLFYDEPKKQKVTITLPSGTVLTIDDENQAVALKDKNGENALNMDLKGGNITLKAKTKLELSAGSTTVTMESGGNLTVKATKEIGIETATLTEKGSAKVSVQGGAVEVKATGTLDLQASGITNVKGSMVNIN